MNEQERRNKFELLMNTFNDAMLTSKNKQTFTVCFLRVLVSMMGFQGVTHALLSARILVDEIEGEEKNDNVM